MGETQRQDGASTVRAIAICSTCGADVDPRRPGTGRQVVGWVQKRTDGGANHVMGQETTGKFMCEICFNDRKRTGFKAPQKETLF